MNGILQEAFCAEVSVGSCSNGEVEINQGSASKLQTFTNCLEASWSMSSLPFSLPAMAQYTIGLRSCLDQTSVAHAQTHRECGEECGSFNFVLSAIARELSMYDAVWLSGDAAS
eukprot:3283799-Amphidinium_carterae.1